MTIKSIRISLIIALFFISLGCFGLHSGIHPLYKDVEGVRTYHYQNLVPMISGILSIILVTILFFFKRYASYAYLITGMTVIIGTITMVHFGIANGRPLIPDIIILFGKFSSSILSYQVQAPELAK